MRKNNFKQSVKELAAKKVGYLCSCPTCSRITIGPHSSKNKTINTGQAAHIYSAAPGGKRYNPDAKDDFVSSEKNCLWLCATHHTLVDSDDLKYTAEELFKWKIDAEKRAQEQLETSTIMFSDIEQKKMDIELIENIFNNYFIDGKIIELFRLISLFEERFKDVNYYPLYSYFKIKIYFFNNKENIKSELQNLIQFGNEFYINKTIDFLIANLCSEILKEIWILIPENRKKIAETIINNQIFEKFIDFPDAQTKYDDKTKIAEEQIELYSKITSNYIIKNIDKLGIGYINPFEKDGKLYSGDFFYTVYSLIYNIKTKISQNGSFFENGSLVLDPEYIKLNSFRGRMLDYDEDFQEIYWRFLLLMQSNKKDFFDVYKDIPESIQADPAIELAKMRVYISENPNEISHQDIIFASKKASDFGPLFDYLNFVLTNNPDLFIKIFENNRDLLLLKSSMLALYIGGMVRLGKNIDILKIKLEFESLYSDDFLYHVILMKLNSNLSKQKEYLNELQVAQKLLLSGATISRYSIELYINTLKENKNFDIASVLLSKNLPTDLKLYIAEILIIDDGSRTNEAKDFLEELLAKHTDSSAIRGILGRYYEKVKNYPKAKDLFKEAFELNPSHQTAYNYFAFLLNTADEIKLEYIKFCENYNDPAMLKLLVNMYVSYGDPEKAKAKYMSYLSLVGESDEKIYGHLLGIITMFPSQNKGIKIVGAGSTAFLENEYGNYVKVSIHNGEIIRSGIGNKFFGCVHYNKNDEEVKNLLYRKENNEVYFDSIKFRIKKIVNSESVYFEYLSKKLKDSGRAEYFVLENNNPQEALKLINELVSTSNKESAQKMNVYNQNPILPISFIAEQIGRDTFNILEYFLFKNKTKIKNNLLPFVSNKWVLSYDVILPLYYLMKNGLDLSDFKFCLTPGTRVMFLTFVKTETINLQSEKRKGVLTETDGKLFFYKNDIDFRSNRLVLLREISDFVKSFEVISKGNDVELFGEVAKIFSEIDVPLEKEIVEVLLTHNEISLITDNVFLAECARIVESSNFGLLSFIAKCGKTSEDILRFIQQLERMNYYTYISIELLKKYYQLLPNDSKDDVINLINGKLFEFNSEEKIQHHKKLIIEICQEVKEENFGDGLTKNIFSVGIEFFKELYPDEYFSIYSNWIGNTN